MKCGGLGGFCVVFMAAGFTVERVRRVWKLQTHASSSLMLHPRKLVPGQPTTPQRIVNIFDSQMVVLWIFFSYQQQIDSLSFIFVVEFLLNSLISSDVGWMILKLLDVVVIEIVVVVYILRCSLKFKLALTYSFTSHNLRRNAVDEG